jgi:L,D-peptidoglycan transpeptidase YkuD (ErfK/YbiS/YcfS/YnhG family)
VGATIAALALAVAGLPGAPAGASACSANLANGLASTGAARQLVTVEAATARSTSGSFRLWQRPGRCWVAVSPAWPAYVGWHGFSTHHREGDGTTPIGTFAFGPVMYGLGPDPGVRYRYHRLVCGDWWDEDPASAAYNTFRHVACRTRPTFGGASEPLWRSPRAYRAFAVLDYNTRPIVPGRGSAMFLHADKGSPTSGCVSLPIGRLDRVLRWLDPAQHPRIVIGTKAGIRSL